LGEGSYSKGKEGKGRGNEREGEMRGKGRTPPFNFWLRGC